MEEGSGWFWADKALILQHASEIGPLGVAIYCYLACLANGDQECFPGLPHLCKTLGISEPCARKYLKLLEERGLLSVDQRTTPAGATASNLYRLKRSSRPAKQTPKVGETSLGVGETSLGGEGQRRFPGGSTSFPHNKNHEQEIGEQGARARSEKEVQAFIKAAVEDYSGRVPSRRWVEETRAEYERALKLGMTSDEALAALQAAAGKGRKTWAEKDAAKHGITPRYLTNLKDAFADAVAQWERRRKLETRPKPQPLPEPSPEVDPNWFIRKVDAGPESEEWASETSGTMRQILRKTYAKRHPEEWAAYVQRQYAIEEAQSAQRAGVVA